MTAELEIDKMLCCAGWGDYDEPDKETAWRRSVDALGEMTLHAEKAGVTLAFEILQPTESNLVHDFASTKRMMEEIVHPNFQLCVDTVPVRREGKTLVDSASDGRNAHRACALWDGKHGCCCAAARHAALSL